jgi:hypothetical protein
MMTPQPHSSALSKLRSKIERLGTTNTERQTLAFGIDAIDHVLPGGGLALGAVHEICEQGTDGARASLSALFAVGILARLPGPVIWCLHSRDLFAPALARVGLHPDRVIYCETWKDAEVLPAMEEGLRHGGLAGVVGDIASVMEGRAGHRMDLADRQAWPKILDRSSQERAPEIPVGYGEHGWRGQGVLRRFFGDIGLTGGER